MVHMIVSGFQYLCFSLWISRPVALSLSRSLDSDSLVISLSLSHLGPLRKHELLKEKRCDSDDGTRAVGILKVHA